MYHKIFWAHYNKWVSRTLNRKDWLAETFAVITKYIFILWRKHIITDVMLAEPSARCQNTVRLCAQDSIYYFTERRTVFSEIYSDHNRYVSLNVMFHSMFHTGRGTSNCTLHLVWVMSNVCSVIQSALIPERHAVFAPLNSLCSKVCVSKLQNL